MRSVAVERSLGTAVLRITGVFCIGMALVALVHPRKPNIPYDRTAMLVSVAIIVLLLGGVALAARRGLIPALPAPGRVLPVAITVVGSALCTLFALAIRYDFGWDARVVASMAERIAHGRGLSDYQYGYLSRYPNNLSLLTVDNLCQRIGHATGLSDVTVFVLLNGLCLAVTVHSTYVLVAMLRSAWAGIAAQFLLFGLVGLSPWMAVSYTDLIGAPFPVLATALVVAAVRVRSVTRRAVFLVGAVAALLVGYEIKTTPAVSVVAIAVVAGLVLLTRGVAGRPRLAVALVAGVVLFLGGALVAGQVSPALAGVSASRIDRSRTAPAVWWVYMGTTEHTVNGQPRYGSYDGAIVRATMTMHRDESGRYAARLLRDRLSELGPGGYLVFLGNKAAWTWGDGMFWAWSEGRDAGEPLLTHGRFTEFVRAWDHPHGSLYTWRSAATQAVWLVLLLVLGARLLRARWRWDIGVLALSVLGIAVFTLVFQARSRYLLVYVPLVVTLVLALPPAVGRLWRGDGWLLGGQHDRGTDGEVPSTEPSLVAPR